MAAFSRARPRGASSATSFRGAVATAVGWAVLLVSTSVEVCVARERARGLETRRSRRQACRALCYAARWCQRCVRARFGRIWAAMRFLLFAPREGARFAGGLASCGGEQPCLVLAVFLTRKQNFDPGCTSNREIRGSNRGSRVFSIGYSDDTDFFESSLPALVVASAGEHGLVA